MKKDKAFKAGDLVEVSGAPKATRGCFYRNGDRGRIACQDGTSGSFHVNFKGCGNTGRRVDVAGANWGDEEPGGPFEGVYGDGVWHVHDTYLKKVSEGGGKMGKPKKAAVKAAAVPKKAYVLVVKDKGGVALGEGLDSAKEIHGPFPTPEAAKRYIAESAGEDFGGGDGTADDALEDWGQDWLLCEVVSVLRPVPRVKVTVEINERSAT